MNGTPEPYCENSINPKTGPPLNISDARSFAVLCPDSVSYTHLDVYKRQLLTPTIFFNLVMQMINGFLAFTQCYIITQGKPMNSTLLYTVYMYKQSFEFYNTGYGAALAWVMLAVIGLITLFLFATKRFWVYEGGL